MFSLDGLYGVRALNEDVDGKNDFSSAELRFPLVDYLGLAFPIRLV